MEVKFDKFSRFETPNFYLCNPGCVLEGSGALSNVIGALDVTSDEQLSLNFNATSDLAFRAYKREVDKSEVADNKYVKIYGHTLQADTHGYQLFTTSDLNKTFFFDYAAGEGYKTVKNDIKIANNRLDAGGYIVRVSTNIPSGTLRIQFKSNSGQYTNYGGFTLVANGYATKLLTLTEAVEDIDSATLQYSSTANTGTFFISDIMLEKGTEAHMWEPYSGGEPGPAPSHPLELESIEKINITVRGKNMYNRDDPKGMKNRYLKSDGTQAASSAYSVISDFIPVKANSNYTFSCSLSSEMELTSSIHPGFMIQFHAEDRALISEIRRTDWTDSLDVVYPFTTPTSTKYVRLCFRTYGDQYPDWTAQLEEGSVATSYEPYREEVKTITPPEPLHSVYTYRDYCDLSAGEWVYNTGELHFKIADMDRTNDSSTYPGWTHSGVSEFIEGGKDLILTNRNGAMLNISADYGINAYTKDGSDAIYLRQKDYSMTQAEWKRNYPDLTVDIVIGRTLGSIRRKMSVEDFDALQSLSDISQGSVISITDQNNNTVSWEYITDNSRSAISKKINATYNAIKNRRLIYLDDLGFFVITEVTEGYSDGLTYKDVTARSCEEEIAGKNVPFIEDGTYRFQGDLIYGKGMLETLVESLPLWRIGDVDEEVAVKYRSFEDVDMSKNILGFMLEDLQDAYECIFVFDIENRLIHVYSQNNYVRRTDIHITKDDLIDELSVEESSEDLYTAITVSGDEELGISAVNPLGGNTIYKFDYYLDWMSPELRNAVTTWQAEVRSASSGYYEHQNAYYASNEELYNLKAERGKLQTQLEMYQKCRDNCVAGSSQEDITKYNDFIEQAGGTPIPENLGYIWIKFADNAAGENITSDPNGKPYIGLAYDKNNKVASLNAADYAWNTFRDRNTDIISTAIDRYTWVVFADTTASGMADEPEGKQYIGIAINQSSADKSEAYSDYMWSSLSTLAVGIPGVIDALSNLITGVTDEIQVIDSQIEAKENELARIKKLAEDIRSALAFNKAFTPEQLEELQCYIYEGTYTDEYITITEDMTATEQFSQMKTLYDRAMLQLDKISVPTQKFEVNLENFIFSKTFEHWSEQLETGCLVNVEIDEGNIAELFLANIEVNYDDRELSMTFGNRYNQYDTMSLFRDALGNIQKSANTLSYIKDIVYPIRSGEFNKMHEALETSRTLTKNAALASTDEEVVIDGSGYTGRRVLPDGTIDSKQIKINGRNIVFTDDSWETCKTAIGELYFSDGDTKYGVNAEVLMGDIILGNELHIIDNEGNELLSAMNDRIATSVHAGNADVSAAIHEAYDDRLDIIDAGVSENKLQIAGAIDQIEQTAFNITQSVALQFETVNESLNEATASLMSIRGQIRQGVIEDPSKKEDDPERWVVGIAIAEELNFTGSTHNGVDILAGGQTLGLYTSKGWQFWINGNKCGWFDSEDSMLHVSNMISEESISVTDNWKFVNESGLGLRFVG